MSVSISFNEKKQQCMDVSSFLWVPNGNRYWSQKVVFDAAVVSLLTYMHCMRNIVENSGDCFLVCGVGIERNLESNIYKGFIMICHVDG